jgi:hypothetical protein
MVITEAHFSENQYPFGSTNPVTSYQIKFFHRLHPPSLSIDMPFFAFAMRSVSNFCAIMPP